MIVTFNGSGWRKIATIVFGKSSSLQQVCVLNKKNKNIKYSRLLTRQLSLFGKTQSNTLALTTINS